MSVVHEERPEHKRDASRPVVVWWFRTRGAEHDAQARGLLKALEAHCPLRVHAAPVIGTWKAWRSGIRRRYPAAALPDPDLLLGTGREAHGAMLAARWARGGRIVTLSKPRLSTYLFDLSIVPEHEGGRGTRRMIATRGVLPPPQVPRPRASGTGLIVVGGPTREHRWSNEEVMSRLTAIFTRTPDRRWFITTTPQTLPTMEQALHTLSAANIYVVPFHEADAHWLLSRLQEVEQAWVSEDSLGVIYQALSAGVATGVLPVFRRKPSREIAALAGWVVSFEAWRDGTALHVPQPPFDEAARCATEIYQRWLAA